jgi:hypothetical protein
MPRCGKVNDKIKTLSMFSNVLIAVICILGGCTMGMVSFVLAHTDHDMKLIALSGVLQLSSTLIAVASTLLIGKAVMPDTHNGITGLPSPLPDNTSMKQTTTLETANTSFQQENKL